MDTILSILGDGAKLISHRDLIVFLIGMLVAWHIPAPSWATALWAKITKKAPVVDTVAQVATVAASTVATEVSNVVDAAQAVTTPVATTTPAVK